MNQKPLTIAMICGGPSSERGISLNSARSFLDHTSSLELDLSIFYLNPNGVYYSLTPYQLYSNTPSDFDFKLNPDDAIHDERELVERWRKVDLVFPMIHGVYGEDGTLQKLLETHSIPFVGSSSSVCSTIFNKHRARNILRQEGFDTLPSLLIQTQQTPIEPFWKEHQLKKAIIKPTESGSSIGVLSVDSKEAAVAAIQSLWDLGFTELLLEPFCEDVEFTTCILENKGKAVSLIPLEIDFGSEGIFDYRKKYLPSHETRYYCPPRFEPKTIERIQSESERLFKTLQLKDFARIDGWISNDGTLRFSDLNPISGMEQNSFLFQQSARVGLTHTDLIEYILTQALWRYGKPAPRRKPRQAEKKGQVFVLMGGETSERQVSLLSGANVWLKLLQSSHYESTPYLLDQNKRVWKLPYGFALHHSVEEMAEHCQNAKQLIEQISPLRSKIRSNLDLPPLPSIQPPESMHLSDFLKTAKQSRAFVFLGLHGGIGEDGTLQQLLEKKAIPFNGSGSKVSRLCMDKHLTAKKIRALKNPSILPMEQIPFRADLSQDEIQKLWTKATSRFKTKHLLIKPQRDGCSTGVVRLHSPSELALYLHLLQTGQRQSPPHTFQNQPFAIEMPSPLNLSLLIEPFIETDKVQIEKTKLTYQPLSGWCEMTIGILEKNGDYEALNPSLTVAMSHVLSVEEKFQGGTGINITPPPSSILSTIARALVKKSAVEAAKALHIEGYARLDLFVECATGKIRLIEANTLPALTPSTVLYHQALTLNPPLPPKELLTSIIKSGETRANLSQLAYYPK